MLCWIFAETVNDFQILRMLCRFSSAVKASHKNIYILFWLAGCHFDLEVTLSCCIKYYHWWLRTKYYQCLFVEVELSFSSWSLCGPVVLQDCLDPNCRQFKEKTNEKNGGVFFICNVLTSFCMPVLWPWPILKVTVVRKEKKRSYIY